MNAQSPPPPRRPYWMLLVLVALFVLPVPAAVAVLVAGALGALALSVARDARARRTLIAEQAGVGEKIVLGTDERGATLALSGLQLSAHGLILGASGAGKTTTLLTILTAGIRQGKPVVAIDMKGSPAFASALAQASAAAGRRFRCWTLDGPERWNPLQHGNATELKDKLLSTERFTEPHYQRAAERYVQTVLQVLRDAHPHGAIGLDEVVDLMEPARLSAALRNVDRARADRVQDYLTTLTPDQLSAIRGLGTRLAIITESDSGAYLSAEAGQRAIDLRRTLEGRDVVLFSLNSSRYGKLAAQIGTLVAQDLIAASGHRLLLPEAQRQQALIGVDEFSALGTDHLVGLLERGRESGMVVLLATQEFADMERVARGLQQQVSGVTALKIFHRQDVPASAQLVADMIGTEFGWEETRTIGGLFSRYNGNVGTRRLVERPIVHPNVIKSLQTGEAIVLRKLPAMSVRKVRVSPPRTRAGRDGPELG